MKVHLIILIVPLILNVVGYSQCDLAFYPKSIIADTTYFVKGNNFKGFIFPENYHGNMVDKSITTFTLSYEQVLKLENILITQHNSIYINDPRNSGYRGERNVNKYLRKFDRQYLGFINEEKEKCAKVILARRRTRKGKKYFSCFDKMMAFGFGSFYEKNQRSFIVNLSKHKLVLP